MQIDELLIKLAGAGSVIDKLSIKVKTAVNDSVREAFDKFFDRLKQLDVEILKQTKR